MVISENVQWNEQKCSMGWMCLLRRGAVSDFVEASAVSDFIGASTVSGSVETGAVLDFVEAFGVFSPIIENGIPVFEQFPRAA